GAASPDVARAAGSRRSHAKAGLAAGAVVIAVLLGWQLALVQNRRPATLQHLPVDRSLEHQRRAAERDVHALLRGPQAKSDLRQRDSSGRQLRLGQAYGRLALIEERAGDLPRRDHYFLLARQALRAGGMKDPTDDMVRRLLDSTGTAFR
ncbi:MAG TPA: hypothetical protein VFO85_14515, partial [Vicinamibacteria bacterium]|nr:hypothetical protein [Vicinamibacteria bacterium]